MSWEVYVNVVFNFRSDLHALPLPCDTHVNDNYPSNIKDYLLLSSTSGLQQGRKLMMLIFFCPALTFKKVPLCTYMYKYVCESGL